MVQLDLIALIRSLAKDCGVDPASMEYCIRRFTAEGIRFLTTTLPKLAKALLRSVEIGYFDRNQLTCFAWKGRSLRYFRSLLDEIFTSDGKVKSDFCVVAFHCLRQFCEYFYKLGLDHEEEEIARASDKYSATQIELAQFPHDEKHIDSLRAYAETHYPDLFRVQPHEILKTGPRFGPGSFAGSEQVENPTLWKLLPEDEIGTCSVDARPYSGYFRSHPSSPVRITLVNTKKVCEVRFVKKDSRGPRVISKEPPFLLKAQMAYFNWSSSTLERITRCRVNFVDQSINQRLAHQGSLDGSNATLDLKDASDRVSYHLVKRIFANSPGVRWFLNKMRSTHYCLPGQKTPSRLYSLSGMGSGLTFPTMAFIIHLAICHGVSKRFGLNQNKVGPRVYVYGDDVIVPHEWYATARASLEKIGLLVNDTKSFSLGPFRESCGGDFVKGNECQPVRLKLAFCSLPKPKSVGRYLSFHAFKQCDITVGLVAHMNECRRNNLIAVAKLVERTLVKYIPLPYVSVGSALLGIQVSNTSLIYDHAEGRCAEDPDGRVKGLTVQPSVQFDSRVCPYKFLGKALKPVRKTYHPVIQWLEESRQVVSYGEYTLPRKFSLKRRALTPFCA